MLAAGNGHHREFRREAFHVLSFLLQKTLRNQQREVHILMARGLETIVELALQQLPDSVAVGLDDHAALDDLGGLGHVALQYDVLIPGSKILSAGSDGRFSHKSMSALFLK